MLTLLSYRGPATYIFCLFFYFSANDGKLYLYDRESDAQTLTVITFPFSHEFIVSY